MWTRGRATQYMHQGLSVVAREWDRERKGVRARLLPKEFARHSDCIEGTTRLKAMEASPWRYSDKGGGL